MEKVQLFFATNRRHEGDNQWKPTSYGKKISSSGHENLRFGELELDFNPKTVQQYIDRQYGDGIIGDGEGLSNYFTEQSKQADITAYEDLTITKERRVELEESSSFQFFNNLKDLMMNTTDVLIYIHGFNVSWDEAVGGALSLQYMLNSKRKNSDRELKVVLFSWPSDGSMMPYIAYRSDRADARDSSKAVGRAILKLKKYLAWLRAKADKDEVQLCEGNIHLLCHSMGNYVLQKSLEDKVDGYSKGTSLPRIFSQVFLCSADVKDDVLEVGKGLSRLHEMASSITVYYNHGDAALATSAYTKNLSERLGHTGNALPASVHNKVHQVDCGPVVHGFVEHSYYLWGSVNRDIWQNVAGIPVDAVGRRRRRNGQNREWVMV